jgi:NitT/TauT family transport system substrate-binding protein
MGFGDMGAAFGGRTIDVALSAEPTATSYVDQGLAVKWLCGADIIPDLQVTYLMFSPHFADQQTELAKRWMVAYAHAARDWTAMLETGQDQDATLSVLGTYTPVKNLALLKRITLPIPAVEAPVDVARITDELSWLHERGYVTQQPSMEHVVDTRFVDGLARAAGH